MMKISGPKLALASTLVSMGVQTQAQDKVISAEQVFKYTLPLTDSDSSEAADRALEVIIDKDGSVSSVDLSARSGTMSRSESCPCVWISSSVCVTVPCGGGTLSTGDRLFVEFEPAGDGSTGIRLKARNIDLGTASEFVLPNPNAAQEE